MADVSQVLSKIEHGDPSAAEQLLPLVYEELRKLAAARMAQEKPGQTLQATALVHEAYLRLVNCERAEHWDGRGHFFAAAGEAMRRILVERARRKSRVKRGAERKRQDLELTAPALDAPDDEILALDEGLAALARRHPEKADLVKMRYFAGMTIPETADALGISAATANRRWTYARAWLYRFLKTSEDPQSSDKS